MELAGEGITILCSDAERVNSFLKDPRSDEMVNLADLPGGISIKLTYRCKHLRSKPR